MERSLRSAIQVHANAIAPYARYYWSGSNTEQEIADKRALYFGAGAVEVWECDQKGQIHFFTVEGQQTASRLAPDFPQQIPLN